MTGCISPYGKPRGLTRRLAEWAGKMGTDRSLPWAGLGIIGDIELAASILNKREWLEAMRLSDDPKAQEFAAELLADDETLEAVQSAADQADALVGVEQGTDPVRVIEMLDEKAQAGMDAYRQVRLVLEQAGVADDQTTDEELPDLLRALLA